MNKKELMSALWIPIIQRLPPDSEDLIFTYNSKNGYCACFNASWAREYAKNMLKNPEDAVKELSWDRQLTHWMPAYAPPNGQTFIEYQERQRQAAKKKRSRK